MTKKKKPINPTFKVVGIECVTNNHYMVFNLEIPTLLHPTKRIPNPAPNMLVAPPTIRSFS